MTDVKEYRRRADELASDNAHLTNVNADLTRELTRLRTENADLREQLDLNQDTLQRRTDAMHRVAQENDHLRSRLANQETQ